MRTRISTVLVSVCVLSGCATQPPAPVAVPANLVPAGEREVGRMSMRSTQSYECRAKPGDPASAEWFYVSSQGDLFDSDGRTFGTHTFPPSTWEANDGSKMVVAITARADAPQPSAAPWLLITRRSGSGEGRFGKVTSMQRVNTVGGMAPVSGCDMRLLGAKQQIPLAADFVLFSR